jgi:hypothetical protein
LSRIIVVFEDTAVRQEENAMNEFMAKLGDQIMGDLSGFDRLGLRGTLRAISYKQGMEGYLSGSSVLLKNFARHVHEVSTQPKRASLAAAQKLGREIRYLASPQQDKDKVARARAATYRDGFRGKRPPIRASAQKGFGLNILSIKIP